MTDPMQGVTPSNRTMSDPTHTPPAAATGQGPGTRSAEGQIMIDAPAERVWHALTDARELERWFPLDARVEPGPGGRIWMSWRNEFVGDMKILVWDPPKHLRTAWAFHESDQPGQVTDYLIEGRGGTTVIRAVTSGFPLDASWDGWVEGTNRGWAFELRSLRHYLERHVGEPRSVAYLRRRVPLSVDAAWARLVGERELAPWLTGGDAFDTRYATQYAAIVRDPVDAMFRASAEPGAPGADLRDIVLWLSAWGPHEPRIREIQARWSDLLVRLFPDGSTP
jgi:uncharacterized protein YndB with AHSA1/START domain